MFLNLPSSCATVAISWLHNCGETYAVVTRSTTCDVLESVFDHHCRISAGSCVTTAVYTQQTRCSKVSLVHESKWKKINKMAAKKTAKNYRRLGAWVLSGKVRRGVSICCRRNVGLLLASDGRCSLVNSWDSHRSCKWI